MLRTGVILAAGLACSLSVSATAQQTMAPPPLTSDVTIGISGPPYDKTGSSSLSLTNPFGVGVPAGISDIRPGRRILGANMVRLGRIVSVDTQGAVVKYDGGFTKVPLRAFGISRDGLVMSITRTDFLRKAKLGA